MPINKRPDPVVLPSLPHCRRCGYDLAGLALSGGCPECGEPAGGHVLVLPVVLRGLGGRQRFVLLRPMFVSLLCSQISLLATYLMATVWWQGFWFLIPCVLALLVNLICLLRSLRVWGKPGQAGPWLVVGDDGLRLVADLKKGASADVFWPTDSLGSWRQTFVNRTSCQFEVHLRGSDGQAGGEAGGKGGPLAVSGWVRLSGEWLGVWPLAMDRAVLGKGEPLSVQLAGKAADENGWLSRV